MRKAIATNTIFYIILGIIVLALLGYLLYKVFVKGHGEIDSKECLAARFNICTNQIPGSQINDVAKVCGKTGKWTDWTCTTTQKEICIGIPTE
jgi:hypothetical protein